MTAPPQLHALCIGIADYPGKAKLPAAARHDAVDLAELLQSSASAPGAVELLVDTGASRAGILAGLERLAARAGPEDLAVVFFSGHGVSMDNGASALVGHYLGSMPAEGLISASTLAAALAQVAAGHLLLIVDACHAAAAHLGPSDPPFSVQALARLYQSKGRVVFAACRDNERAAILPGEHNSLFTGCLLTALRGAAARPLENLVRVFDVFSYVAERVKRASPEQHPVFKAADLEDNFPILPAVLPAAWTPPSAPPTQDLWTDLMAHLPDLYPTGPNDDELWTRAGGSAARLPIARNGRSAWYAALRLVRLGGGPTLTALLIEALRDYPHHPGLQNVLSQGA